MQDYNKNMKRNWDIHWHGRKKSEHQELLVLGLFVYSPRKRPGKTYVQNCIQTDLFVCSLREKCSFLLPLSATFSLCRHCVAFLARLT